MKKGKERMTTVSVDRTTLRAIKLIAGEIQADTGEALKMNDAIWRFIVAERPDIAERAEKLSGEKEDAQ